MTEENTEEVVSLDAPQPKGGAQPKGSPSQPQEQLPTDRIAFEKQLKLLQAYAHASESGKTPVNNEDVARVVEMNSSTVSLANAFFVKMGFLTRTGREFLPNKEVVEYANAVQWSPDNAAHKLRPIVEETWFWQTAKPKLLMRAVSEKEVVADLAQKAMVGPEHRPQLRMLVNYLVASGLVQQDGDSISLVRDVNSPASKDPSTTKAEPPPTPQPEKPSAANPPPPSKNFHPLIEGLLETLPPEGDEWPAEKRKKWLDAAGHIFDLIYTEGN